MVYIGDNPLNSLFSGTSTAATIGASQIGFESLCGYSYPIQQPVNIQQIVRDSVREYQQKKPDSFNKKYGYRDDYKANGNSDLLTRLRAETREFCGDVIL